MLEGHVSVKNFWLAWINSEFDLEIIQLIIGSAKSCVLIARFSGVEEEGAARIEGASASCRGTFKAGSASEWVGAHPAGSAKVNKFWAHGTSRELFITDIFLFEFSGNVSLDKGCLSNSSITNENQLEICYDWLLCVRRVVRFRRSCYQVTRIAKSKNLHQPFLLVLML